MILIECVDSHMKSHMKTKKVPRERNPFLLTGKRRWRLFHWVWPCTGRLLPRLVWTLILFCIVVPILLIGVAVSAMHSPYGAGLSQWFTPCRSAIITQPQSEPVEVHRAIPVEVRRAELVKLPAPRAELVRLPTGA